MYKRNRPLQISNFLDAKMLQEIDTMHYGEKIKKVGEDLKVLALKFYGECCDVYVDKETPMSSICIVKDDKHVIIQYDHCYDVFQVLHNKNGRRHLKIKRLVKDVESIDAQFYIDAMMWQHKPVFITQYIKFWYEPLSIETFSYKKC